MPRSFLNHFLRKLKDSGSGLDCLTSFTDVADSLRFSSATVVVGVRSDPVA
jgi:hypothetical protein